MTDDKTGVVKQDEIPMTTLLKLIPEFDTTKPNQVYRYVRSCDSAFNLAALSQSEILLTYALNRITGPLSSDVHVKIHNTWPDLKSFLIAKFSQTKTLAHLNLELQAMFQKPNETVTEYFIRVDLCRNKILEKLTAEIDDQTLEGRKITTEETALNVFINGLSSDIGVMLRTRNFANLTNAGNFAVQEDKIRCMNRARQYLFRATPSKQQSTPSRTFTPSSQQSTSDRSFVPAQVTNPNRTCNYCKKPGHLIQECRKRAYNNAMRNQTPAQPIPTRNIPNTNPGAKQRQINNLNSQVAVETDHSSVIDSVHYTNSENENQLDETPNLDQDFRQKW